MVKPRADLRLGGKVEPFRCSGRIGGERPDGLRQRSAAKVETGAALPLVEVESEFENAPECVKGSGKLVPRRLPGSSPGATSDEGIGWSVQTDACVEFDPLTVGYDLRLFFCEMWQQRRKRDKGKIKAKNLNLSRLREIGCQACVHWQVKSPRHLVLLGLAAEMCTMLCKDVLKTLECLLLELFHLSQDVHNVCCSRCWIGRTSGKFVEGYLVGGIPSPARIAGLCEEPAYELLGC